MGALRILVCVKRVPAPGARITLTADHQGIDTKNLGFTTSPHEECAVEEAIRLVEIHGGSATVLTAGAAEAVGSEAVRRTYHRHGSDITQNLWTHLGGGLFPR